jgi:hypothetical protein
LESPYKAALLNEITRPPLIFRADIAAPRRISGVWEVWNVWDAQKKLD